MVECDVILAKIKGKAMARPWFQVKPRRALEHTLKGLIYWRSDVSGWEFLWRFRRAVINVEVGMLCGDGLDCAPWDCC